jgi:DNA-binding PadR family transcriptional regulator
MSTPKTPHRSSLGLLVLWQLFQEPMHVYRMQKLFEAEGKGRIVNVRARASLYQAIERLVRHGLAEVAETVQIEGYPDRTVYAITDAGREMARQWLREMLSNTEGEFPEFVAAVSILFALSPQEAQAELERRAEKLTAALREAEGARAKSPPGLPRLFLLEDEYRAAVLTAELAWVRGVIDDLRAGRLTWSEEWLRQVAETFLPDANQDNH